MARARNKVVSPKLILASASPRRKLLMRQSGYRYRVVVSNVSENAPRGLSPAKLVTHLALKKAMSVARRNPNDLVLGADTLVFLDGKAIGKPKDAQHAARMLKGLSGRWQRVYTGVAVVWEGGRRKLAQAAVSYVKFRRLNQQEIESASKRNLDKAGAYAVQEKKDGFVETIKGDYDNVVGLPMRVVRRLLRGGSQALLKRLGYKADFER